MTSETLVQRPSFDPRTVWLIHDLRNALASSRAAAHMLSRSPSDQAVVTRAVAGIQSPVKDLIASMDDFVGHEPAPQPGGPASPAQGTGSLHVLIADDNVDAANTLATWLRMQGDRTAVAFDGEAA